MRYIDFSVDDFIEDEKFKEWTYHPNEENVSFWESWLENNSDKKDVVNMSKELLLTLKFNKNELTEERKQILWSRIVSINSDYDSTHSEVKLVKHSNERITKILKYAAAVSLLLTSAYLLYLNASQNIEARPASKIVIKSNPSGQKSQVQLPDGSIVRLNSESSLSYDDEFSKGRIVEVVGEAYFEVRKDSLHPFIVHANHLEATALGTSFNVKAQAEANKTEISLLTGLLLVEDTLNRNSITLHPSEVANSGIPGQQIQKYQFDLEKVTYWVDGIIHFDKTNFIEVVESLEKWYGVNIKVKNLPVRSMTCTGKFTNENLDNVLNNLGFSIGFEYTIKGRSVEIIFN